MARLTDTERMIKKTGPSLQATGMKIISLAQVEKSGLMAPAFMAVTFKAKRMGMEFINGLTVLSI